MLSRLQAWLSGHYAHLDRPGGEDLPLLSLAALPAAASPQIPSPIGGVYNRHASTSMRRRRHIPFPKSDSTIITASRHFDDHGSDGLAVRCYQSVTAFQLQDGLEWLNDGGGPCEKILLARLAGTIEEVRVVIATLLLSPEDQHFIERRLVQKSSSGLDLGEVVRYCRVPSGSNGCHDEVAVVVMLSTTTAINKKGQAAMILFPSRNCAAILFCGVFVGLQPFILLLDAHMRKRHPQTESRGAGNKNNAAGAPIQVLLLLASTLLHEAAREVRSLCASIAEVEQRLSVVAEKESARDLLRLVHQHRRQSGAALRLMEQKQKSHNIFLSELVNEKKLTPSAASPSSPSSEMRDQVEQLQLTVANCIGSLLQARDILTGVTARTSAGVQLRNQALGTEIDGAAVVMSQLNAWCLPGSIIANVLSMSVRTPNESIFADNYDFFFVVVTFIVFLVTVVVFWEASEVKFEGKMFILEQARRDALRAHFAALGAEPVEVSRDRHLILAVQGGGSTMLKALTTSSLLAHIRSTEIERLRSQSCPNLPLGGLKSGQQMTSNWLDVLRAGSDELLRVLSCFADRLDVEKVVGIVSSILVNSVSGKAASIDDEEQQLVAGQQPCGPDGSFCVGLVCLDSFERPCRVAVVYVDPQWVITIRAANVPALNQLHEDIRRSHHHHHSHREGADGDRSLGRASSFCGGAKVAEIATGARSRRHRSWRQLSCSWLLSSLQEGAIATCGASLSRLLDVSQQLERDIYGAQPWPSNSYSPVGSPSPDTVHSQKEDDERAMRRVVETRRSLNAKSKFLLAVEHQSRELVLGITGSNDSTTFDRLRVSLSQTLEVTLALRGRYIAACASLQRVTTTIAAFATANDSVETAARNSNLLWFTELDAACLPALLVYKVMGMSVATPLAATRSLAAFWVIVMCSAVLLAVIGTMAMRERWKKQRKISKARNALRLARATKV